MLFLKRVDSLLGGGLVRLLSWAGHANGVPTKIARILVVRPGGIGDAVLLIPLLQKLSLLYPDAQLDVLAERRNAGAFALTRTAVRVYRYDCVRELFQVFRQRYDLIIDTEQWHRLSACLARMLKPGCLVGFGTNDRRRLLDYAVDYSQDDYEMASFDRLMEPVGNGSGYESGQPFLSVPDAASVAASRWLVEIDRPLVCLFPGASIIERRWGAGKFADLARQLAVRGIASIVVGGREDRIAGDTISGRSAAVNLAGMTSLAETAALLKASSCLVSGDSGVLHLAVGLGVPTVSLFGPGRRDKWAPCGGRHVIIDHRLECSPCTTFGTTPPCNKGAECVANIEVDEVLTATLGLLSPGDVT